MNVSDRDVDLSEFFPFKSCSNELLINAQGLGRCVKYDTGEPVLLSGSLAKHCGLIVSGEAVAFKIDEAGKRYQLCLDEGCFIGLETIEDNGVYNAKIVALTELEVFFWNTDGLYDLMGEYPEFADALHLLNDGRIYQEQWLIPDTDVTDPVLCSLSAHWLSVALPVGGILLLLFFFLWVCSLLIRQYPVAWLLVLALFVGAGSLLYREIIRRTGERIIVTTKNFIRIPGQDGSEMSVTRLDRIRSLHVDQNVFERLFGIGKIGIHSENGSQMTPLLRMPDRAASLIRFFAVRLSKGRQIPLIIGKEQERRRLSASRAKKHAANPAGGQPAGYSNHDIPKFQTIEFRAHWALLVKMWIKPLLVLAGLLFVSRFLQTGNRWLQFRKFFLLAGLGCVLVMVYRFIEWRNHRFTIEEDCVRDYSKKPFSSEDQNMAMNHKIQSVRFQKKGFFQVLLNYGTVYILAGEGELSFDYVGDPQNVQKQILDNCARFEAQRMLDAETRQREYINGLVSGIREEAEEKSGYRM